MTKFTDGFGDTFEVCARCGARIEKINFSLGPEWRHWPTLYGNYTTREKYLYCQNTGVATPDLPSLPKPPPPAPPVAPEGFRGVLTVRHYGPGAVSEDPDHSTFIKYDGFGVNSGYFGFETDAEVRYLIEMLEFALYAGDTVIEDGK